MSDTDMNIDRYLTISEVSKILDLKAHVLRYWEQVFPQLSPMKRKGGRRYYQQKDVELIKNIRSLLYEQGYTISGAVNFLNQSSTSEQPVIVDQPDLAINSDSNLESLSSDQLLGELEQLVDELSDKS